MLLIQKENQVNQVIPDEGGLMDSIKIAHDGAITSIKVSINIEHPYIGDLKVDLTGPSGTSVTLHDREGGAGNDIEMVYEGDAVGAFMGESAIGDWTLAIQDFAPRDEGSLASWSVEMRCEQERSEIFIPEEEGSWLISEQKCGQGGIIEDATLAVDIEHSYVGDLVVKLTCPDGEEIMLRDREGGSANNLNVVYDMDTLGAIAGKNTEGTWTLQVQDNADGDQGLLKHWKLGFRYQKIEDLSKVAGLSEDHLATLAAAGAHSYGRLSTWGTTKVMETLGMNHVDANALLDAAKAAASGDFGAPEAAVEEVAEEA